MKTNLWKTMTGAALVALAMQTGYAGEDGPRPGPGREGMRAKMLEKFDADGDGKLSESERAAAREAMEKHRGEHGGKGPPEGMREKVLEKFDADGDGKLNDAEREAAKKAWQERQGAGSGGHGGPGMPEEMRKKMLEKFDADGDGKLNEAEREAAKKAWHERQGGKDKN